MTVKSPFLSPPVSYTDSTLVTAVENKSSIKGIGSSDSINNNNNYSKTLKSDYTMIINISIEYIQLRNIKEKRRFDATYDVFVTYNIPYNI